MPTKKSKATIKIQDTLRTMMANESTPLGTISVTELCEKAGVSRNTFYYHYSSPTDVYQEIVDDIADAVTQYVGEAFKTLDIEVCLRNTLVLIKQNPTIFELKNYSKIYKIDYFTRIHAMAMEALKKYHSDLSFTEEEIGDIIVFLVGGNYQMVLQWIRNGMATPIEEQAKRMHALTLTQIGGLISPTMLK